MEKRDLYNVVFDIANVDKKLKELELDPIVKKYIKYLLKREYLLFGYAYLDFNSETKKDFYDIVLDIANIDASIKELDINPIIIKYKKALLKREYLLCEYAYLDFKTTHDLNDTTKNKR